jgi:uncharacterized peroxidase-related enzyme
MPRIEIIQPETADGRLKEIYGEIVNKRGKIAEVHKIQSLNPETIITHMELYLSIMFSQSPLTRAEREMIAVVVSSSNGCSYCVKHHGDALNHYWKDQDKVNLLAEDFSEIELSEKHKKLCEYARELTINPDIFEKTDFVKKLKSTGLNDREILDATLVIAYFNFVNRMVLSLGVKLEKEGGQGYIY